MGTTVFSENHYASTNPERFGRKRRQGRRFDEEILGRRLAANLLGKLPDEEGLVGHYARDARLEGLVQSHLQEAQAAQNRALKLRFTLHYWQPRMITTSFKVICFFSRSKKIQDQDFQKSGLSFTNWEEKKRKEKIFEQPS